ncbi:MAG TPA: FAD binding domain-containing protein [Patescibacteria group bacterium]|nr:FAD binding domain-containing protein [Patescibacteria group bacterium]
MHTNPNFMLNGRAVDLADAEPTQSLLRWLKSRQQHGTKEGCGDGDCGACTVAMVETDADGRSHYRAVNSCLLPMGALPGREIVTVEGLADGERLHPAQRVMVDGAGSQCGYCTPGFVMSLFVGTHDGDLSDHCIEGNLCRCTGYRPIRDAAKRLAALPIVEDRFGAALQQPRAALTSARVGDFHNPGTLTEALALKQRHPDAIWIAGATDLGVNLSRGQTVAPAFIALDRIAELQGIDIDTDAVRIGAGVSLSRIEHELAGLFPLLDDMLPWFAAKQVKNRATFGGSLGSASPIGDLAPILLALGGSVHLAGPNGVRDLPIDGYFLDYRKTQRHADELIVAVTLPRPRDLVTASYKIAKRQTDDISIVAASYAIRLDRDRRVLDVRLAYGGVAAIPSRAVKTEALLIGEVLGDALVERARASLVAEFAPLSDHRADADYRRALAGNLFAKFVAEKLA